MASLNRSDLLSLEAYRSAREAFQTRVSAHQKTRTIGLGEHASLSFEDQLTVQYRIQEWLHAECSAEAATIQTRLDTFNRLIPDGHNLKASLHFAYAGSAPSKLAGAAVLAFERRVYAEVEGLGRSFAIVDESISQPSGTDFDAHLLRFEFSAEQISSVRAGAEFGFGIDDDRMRVAHTLKRASRAALLADFG